MLQHLKRKLSEHVQNNRRMSYANMRIILLEKNIQCAMQIVFYRPVTALHLQEFFSRQAFAAAGLRVDGRNGPTSCS